MSSPKSLLDDLPAPIKGTGQVPFSQSRASSPGFFGGAGTGKTEQGASRVLETCGSTGCNGLVTAPFWKMVERAVLPTYKKLLTDDGKHPAYACADPGHPWHETKQCIELRNGATIWFATADNPTALQGSNIGIAQMDEVCLTDEKVTDIEDAEVFKAVKQRLRQPMPPGWTNQLLATGTPKGVDHWTYKVWGDSKRSDTLKTRTPWWGMTVYENPFLPPDYIRDLEETFGTTGDFARQELYGDWIVSNRGRIFDSTWFQRYDERPDFLATVGTWDTAQSAKEWASYTVGQIWGVRQVENDYHYYLLDMFRAKVEYAIVKKVIRDATNVYGLNINIIEDKQSGQMALQELASEGIRVAAYRPGTDKTDRAQQASVAVQEGRVFIPSEEFARNNGMTWLDDFTSEVFRAPFIINWDVVDAMSQFILWAEERRHVPERPRILSVTSNYGRSQSYGRTLRH